MDVVLEVKSAESKNLANLNYVLSKFSIVGYFGFNALAA